VACRQTLFTFRGTVFEMIWPQMGLAVVLVLTLKLLKQFFNLRCVLALCGCKKCANVRAP
jgi:hypothetical protein